MRVRRAGLILPATALPSRCMTAPPRFQAEQIVRISRMVSDLDRAEAFYRDAGVSCRRARTRRPGDAGGARRGRGAEEVVMRLGAQDIALVRFTGPGRPYPPDSRSNDLWFQHLAIVVTDMDAAYAQLSRIGLDADQRGRPTIASAIQRRRMGVQIPGSRRASAGTDLVSLRPGPRRLARGRILGAVPWHRSQRARGCVHAAEPRVLSRAGLACGRTIGQLGPPRKGWMGCRARECG